MGNNGEIIITSSGHSASPFGRPGAHRLRRTASRNAWAALDPYRAIALTDERPQANAAGRGLALNKRAYAGGKELTYADGVDVGDWTICIAAVTNSTSYPRGLALTTHLELTGNQQLTSLLTGNTTAGNAGSGAPTHADAPAGRGASTVGEALVTVPVATAMPSAPAACRATFTCGRERRQTPGQAMG